MDICLQCWLVKYYYLSASLMLQDIYVRISVYNMTYLHDEQHISVTCANILLIFVTLWIIEDSASSMFSTRSDYMWPSLIIFGPRTLVLSASMMLLITLHSLFWSWDVYENVVKSSLDYPSQKRVKIPRITYLMPLIADKMEIIGNVRIVSIPTLHQNGMFWFVMAVIATGSIMWASETNRAVNTNWRQH